MKREYHARLYRVGRKKKGLKLPVPAELIKNQKLKHRELARITPLRNGRGFIVVFHSARRRRSRAGAIRRTGLGEALAVASP
ncbi:MAG: hypothetical protein QXV14_06365 [Candidatus Caldarchaeum sp.]